MQTIMEDYRDIMFHLSIHDLLGYMNLNRVRYLATCNYCGLFSGGLCLHVFPVSCFSILCNTKLL